MLYQQTGEKTLKSMNVTPEAISFQEQIHLMIGKKAKPLQMITNKDIYIGPL
jgi:hypothetical protein